MRFRAIPRPSATNGDVALDYEKLDVYRAAIEFLRLAIQATAALPHREAELRGQLKRAALSIPLNIAEGSGKTTTPDRSRFYVSARGSAMECGALFDVCHIAGFVTQADHEEAKVLLTRIVSMLTRMCR